MKNTCLHLLKNKNKLNTNLNRREFIITSVQAFYTKRNLINTLYNLLISQYKRVSCYDGFSCKEITPFSNKATRLTWNVQKQSRLQACKILTLGLRCDRADSERLCWDLTCCAARSAAELLACTDWELTAGGAAKSMQESRGVAACAQGRWSGAHEPIYPKGLKSSSEWQARCFGGWVSEELMEVYLCTIWSWWLKVN